MKLPSIRALIEAATPPEKWDATENSTSDGRFSYATGPWHDQTNGDTGDAYNDTRFIAASRTLMPKLLAVAEAAALRHGKDEDCYCSEYPDLPCQSCRQADAALDKALAALESD